MAVHGRRRSPGTASSALAVRRRSLGSRLRSDWPFIAMTLPALLLLAVFHYFPMLGNVMAFQDYSPYAGPGFQAFLNSEWVGLENFRQLFDDPSFWKAVVNTLVLTGLNLVFFFPVPIILALALNSWKSYWVKAITQSVLYLPHFLSWVVVVTLFSRLFGRVGLVTGWLQGLGINPPDVISNPHWFPALATVQSIWKDAGWGVIVFLAALAAVSNELHESAAVDGASRWRRLWHVTLPAIRPTIILLLILRLGDALNVGFEQFLLQRQAVGPDASEVLDTYTYYVGIDGGGFSLGAAAGLLKGLVGLVLILLANKAAHAMGEDGVFKGKEK